MKYLKFWAYIVLLLLTLVALGLSIQGLTNQNYGAGYAPVTGYQTMTTSRISASASTIPVASVVDKAGNAIVPGSISTSSTVRMYFNLEPGTTREEPIYCTGISSSNLTGCVRGISFQGTDLTASSTIAQIHNAGSAVIMTNLGVMYGNEFVSIDGTQNIYGAKTFYTNPTDNSSTDLCSADNQYCTKYYIDSVGAGGMTSANVSTTLGLLATGSSPEKVGIRLSSTLSGLQFLSATSYALGVNTSSTKGIAIDTLGRVYLDTTDAMKWTGTQTLTALTATGNVSLTGNVTSTGTLRANNPTIAKDVSTKEYTDVRVMGNYATGTAKLAITAGKAIWVGPTSTLAMTDTTGATSTYKFIGFAVNSAAVGAMVTYAKEGGIICGLSLTPGLDYYLAGASGAISTTSTFSSVFASADTQFSARVGRALSSSCLAVTHPIFQRHGVQNMDASSGDYKQVTGFFPARITVDGITSFGGNEMNQSYTLGSPPATQSYAYTGATLNTHGTIVLRTPYGFTFRHVKNASEAATAYWTAYSE
jgi:hypothetical protein